MYSFFSVFIEGSTVNLYLFFFFYLHNPPGICYFRHFISSIRISAPRFFGHYLSHLVVLRFLIIQIYYLCDR
ncbi:hypothetical protein B0H34DRAFT_76366 [Crassisporium funariophilum]|nr:hypothetical protein B0H34DRAFT_76366 [Crassisporium funariophilum]